MDRHFFPGKKKKNLKTAANTQRTNLYPLPALSLSADTSARAQSGGGNVTTTNYRELGLPQPQAKAKAVFVYAAYRGLLQVVHEAPTLLPTD
jgi:hypothetical protein